jgi:hypothetical protein
MVAAVAALSLGLNLVSAPADAAGGHSAGGYGGRGYGYGGGGYGWRGYGGRGYGYGYAGYGYRGYGYYGYRGFYPYGYYPVGFYGGLALGLYFSTLPYYYSTVYYGGVPYYYAAGNYYLYDAAASRYVTVSPPTGAGAPASASAGGKLFAYPKHQLSAEQQEQDRAECRQFAVAQTGLDPGAPPSGTNASQHGDFARAESACLEGRDYVVR